MVVGRSGSQAHGRSVDSRDPGIVDGDLGILVIEGEAPQLAALGSAPEPVGIELVQGLLLLRADLSGDEELLGRRKGHVRVGIRFEESSADPGRSRHGRKGQDRDCGDDGCRDAGAVRTQVADGRPRCAVAQ